jgi:serine/threonine protein kinase
VVSAGLDSVPHPGPDHWQPPTAEELQRLIPQYEVETMIGRGGMGAVYKGHQKRLGRRVAIKLLPAEVVGGEPDFHGFEICDGKERAFCRTCDSPLEWRLPV